MGRLKTAPTDTLRKIVSGGQTGVDAGALDAALDADFACGGWAPEDRTNERGPLPQRYPLQPLARGMNRERTSANVIDSDATAVVLFGEAQGGTKATLEDCATFARPSLIIDASRMPIPEAVRVLRAFIQEHEVETLNVAGPRASEEPHAYAYAHGLISGFLDREAVVE